MSPTTIRPSSTKYSAPCSPCRHSIPKMKQWHWPIACPQGLAAGIQTSNLARAHRVSARLEAGIVWVNGWALMDPAVPFGGVKVSGWGRENGPEGLANYYRSKSVVFNLQE